MKGATLLGGIGAGDWGNFNPRSREGSDARVVRPPGVGVISIHAPVKGATRFRPSPAFGVQFQSTLP